MPNLSPTTLTTDEQRLILRATAGHIREEEVASLLGPAASIRRRAPMHDVGG
jgi:hypothetical protein